MSRRNRAQAFLAEWLVPIAFGCVLVFVMLMFARWFIWWAIAP